MTKPLLVRVASALPGPHGNNVPGGAPALVMWGLVSLNEGQPIRVEYCGLDCVLGRNITLYHRVPYEALFRPARGTDP